MRHAEQAVIGTRRRVLNSTDYSKLRAHAGAEVEVARLLNEPEEYERVESEAGPMYEARRVDTGELLHLFTDELGEC